MSKDSAILAFLFALWCLVAVVLHMSLPPHRPTMTRAWSGMLLALACLLMITIWR